MFGLGVHDLLPRNRHLTELEQGTSCLEVKGDGATPPPLPSDAYLKLYAKAAAEYTSKRARNERVVRFVGERQERERTRAGITTEGAEAIHHFIGESLLCAAHAQSEYHKSPREATTTAMDEARAMVSDGINVLSGTTAPEALIQYVRDDDGIYGRP